MKRLKDFYNRYWIITLPIIFIAGVSFQFLLFLFATALGTLDLVHNEVLTPFMIQELCTNYENI